MYSYLVQQAEERGPDGSTSLQAAVLFEDALVYLSSGVFICPKRMLLFDDSGAHSSACLCLRGIRRLLPFVLHFFQGDADQRMVAQTLLQRVPHLAKTSTQEQYMI